MSDKQMPTCPECEKLTAASSESQVIGEFIEWLQETYCDDVEMPRVSIERLLAEFFEIDLDKVEVERRALLDFIQEEAAP